MKKWKRWLGITLTAVMMTGCAGTAGNPKESTAQPAETAAKGTTAPASEAQPQEDAGSHEFPAMTLRFGTTSAEGTLVVTTMKDFSDRVSKATAPTKEIQTSGRKLRECLVETKGGV